MASQRDTIRMSDEEVSAFLAASRSLNVATLDRDGAPHLTTLWFTRQADGTILFETYGASQKVVNLRRDPRVAVLCEAGESYDQLRGVSITGRAEIVEAQPRLSQLMTRLVAHHHPGVTGERLAATVAAMVRKRVVVIVHPEKVISWDHRKLPAPQG
jgi:PPOX class probable F420-dependent enzyme